MTSWRQQATEGIAPGMTVRFSRTFTQEETNTFGDITRDYNPVHYDERFAKQKGFTDLICHGLLVGGMVCELGGQVGWLATGMKFLFKRPVYFGDTVTCEITVRTVDENGFAVADARFTNQSGDEVLEAKISGLVPAAQDRALLATMISEGDPTNKIAGER
ncbi:MAG TPA: MaoC family dehydratase [Spirochaetota bacterium]|mgnify:CR=1 FL=1|nr:MaoC family dehydratase [Spirochaetota bacterium]HPI21965.1 MaoC family dehydratase [Spirochaetota bacterium]HPU87608.1 MaoC family dehydratase [Spirochaetota bacterium]